VFDAICNGCMTMLTGGVDLLLFHAAVVTANRRSSYL
jgi:hypothetical protein